MQNKWTASVSKKDTTEDVKSATPEKNNSKKIGLVMGIVGAVLVTAGAAPMLFGNSENLTGDITEQAEAVDPLVALLSGGNTTTETKTTPTNKPNPTPIATVKPAATVKPVAVKATPPPTAQVNTSDKTVKVTNANTGTTDKKGENFHNASALVNTSNQNIQVTNGNTSTSITTEGVSVTTGNTSIQTSTKTTVKPPRNIQTGFDSNMMIGLLFLLASGVLFIRSRKSA